jgi:hypothetical protein
MAQRAYIAKEIEHNSEKQSHLNECGKYWVQLAKRTIEHSKQRHGNTEEDRIGQHSKDSFSEFVEEFYFKTGDTYRRY